MTLENVLVVAFFVALLYIFPSLGKAVDWLRHPFSNRPSMRTRFYLQERKERERKRGQRKNSN
jgi:hypothetical protein